MEKIRHEPSGRQPVSRIVTNFLCLVRENSWNSWQKSAGMLINIQEGHYPIFNLDHSRDLGQEQDIVACLLWC